MGFADERHAPAPNSAPHSTDGGRRPEKRREKAPAKSPCPRCTPSPAAPGDRLQAACRIRKRFAAGSAAQDKPADAHVAELAVSRRRGAVHRAHVAVIPIGRRGSCPVQVVGPKIDLLSNPVQREQKHAERRLLRFGVAIVCHREVLHEKAFGRATRRRHSFRRRIVGGDARVCVGRLRPELPSRCGGAMRLGRSK